MTPEQLAVARAFFLGKSADVSAPGFPRVWTCDNLNWTGVRCAVALNDGQGGYRDLDLPPDCWDPAKFGGWLTQVVTSLRAETVDDAEMAALAALNGLEV